MDGRGIRIDLVALAAAIATLICAAPALGVIGFALAGGESADFGGNLLRDGAIGTLALVMVGGGGAIAIGATSAWLVSLCAFPGRGLFEWLLVIPLAAPSYVLAYAYSGMTWAGGPLVALPVVGFWGAAFIYAIGLYPYVYLAARAAFASQSSCSLEAARTLGVKPGALFLRVGLPLARPGIVAGGALVLMEIAADYGAAKHFGLTTLSTAIFRAWYDHQSAYGALQIASVLLVAALVFLILERRARGRAGFAGGSTRWRALPRYTLSPPAALGALTFCAALVILGAVLPLGWLAMIAVEHTYVDELRRAFFNTILLAGAGAFVTLILAAIIAAAARRGGPIGKLSLFAAGMGYAAPGAVLALGAFSLFGLAREWGFIGGVGTVLALVTLIWAYAARFTAAGAQPVDAGLARLSKGLDASARVLGAGPVRRLWRVDLPIAAPSLAAAALILFVDILKELPATLIIRPFNFETLAVIAYSYASDEQLALAAAPSLLIFVAGLAPILLLTRSIASSRAGSQ